MNAINIAVDRLKTEEGFRAVAYRDSIGRLTIGYGFCVDAGISQFAAEALLASQAQERAQQLLSYPWYQALDDPRASVLIDLAFNNGTEGLLHFTKMLAAISAKNWQIAHDELLDSQAARALPARYQELAEILLTGVIPEVMSA